MTDREKSLLKLSLYFSSLGHPNAQTFLPLHVPGKSPEARTARQKLTQCALAQQTMLSIPTIRLLESGQGNLSTFLTVLHTLNLDIVGRNLPPGESIGAQIITLRKRKGISQRELIKLVGMSQPTLIELERHATGRSHTPDRVLTILGAGAYLAPQGSTKAFYVHAGNSSTSEHWETLQELLEQLYSVFGAFDLDPCSPTSNSRTAPVQAKVHYTEDDDGLALPWFGTVFMNPPYGRCISRWTAKAKAEVEQGKAEVVIALLPARPDTHYWHRDIAGSASVFFLKGRLKFGNTEQVAPFPSCLVVWGASEEVITAIQAALPEAWLSR